MSAMGSEASDIDDKNPLPSRPQGMKEEAAYQISRDPATLRGTWSAEDSTSLRHHGPAASSPDTALGYSYAITACGQYSGLGGDSAHSGRSSMSLNSAGSLISSEVVVTSRPSKNSFPEASTFPTHDGSLETTIAHFGVETPLLISNYKYSTDANDDSLQRYKESLGLGGGKDLSDPSDTRVCIIQSLTLESPNRPPVTIDLSTPGSETTLKDKPFKIKEGSKFTMVASFKVQHEILSGLQYVQVVKRKGIKVSKDSEMLVSRDTPVFVHIACANTPYREVTLPTLISSLSTPSAVSQSPVRYRFIAR